MRILLIAEESAGIRLLTELNRLPHQVVAVMAQEPAGSPHASCVWNTARKLGHDTWPAALVKDPAAADRVRQAGADLILNVHSLFLVHESILGAAALGAFNLHPGPLPQYAGLNAPSWAIYNGERQHAVTLHRMARGIDTGDVAFEHRFDITSQDTGLSVALRCVQFGIPLVLQLIELAARDPAAIPRIRQDPGQRRYYGRTVPQEGRIFWDQPARRIFDFVRACDYAPFHSPWGQPVTSLGGRQFGITRVALTAQPTRDLPGTIRTGPGGPAYVACSDEWLELKRVVDVETGRKPEHGLPSGQHFAVR